MERKGMRVKWETLGGDKYEGEVYDYDGDSLHVKLDNGEKKAVDPKGVEII